ARHRIFVMVASQCIRQRLSNETQVEERRFSAASAIQKVTRALAHKRVPHFSLPLRGVGKPKECLARALLGFTQDRLWPAKGERLKGRANGWEKCSVRNIFSHTIMVVSLSTYKL